MNVIRIWEKKAFFAFSVRMNVILAIDYTLNDDHMKIEYLNPKESKQISKSALTYIENICTKNNKTKIIVDVHNNLKIFDEYYRNEGFKITNRRSIGNKFWLEAEKNIDLTEETKCESFISE